MDHDSIERIRTATFPVARRGYERRDVDRFLARLADWLETGGADQARAEILRRDLERIGETTGKILTDAHDAGEGIRGEAEREAGALLRSAEAESEAQRSAAREHAAQSRSEAEAYAAQTRADADEYAAEARAEADAYAAATRAGADAYSDKVRMEADEFAADIRARAEHEGREIVSKAKADARRTVADAERRRDEVAKIITDLEERRDAAIADLERLASEVVGAATQHRAPAPDEVAAADSEPTAPVGAARTPAERAGAKTPRP